MSACKIGRWLPVYFLVCYSAWADIGDSLLLGEAEKRVLPPGQYRLNTLDIGKNAVLEVAGSTTITVKTFRTAEGATIKYTGTLAKPNDAHIITINAVNASDISGIKVVANGKSETGYKAGERAKDGPAGEKGYGTGELLAYPGGKGCSKGQGGVGGQKGPQGGNAAHVTLYLPGLKPDTSIYVEAIGGNGGRGQDGGNGGKGGDGAWSEPGCDGGVGGSAGSGGNGGDSGKIEIFLVVASSEIEQRGKDTIIKGVRITPIYGAGVGGQPGVPGLGGEHGSKENLDKSMPVNGPSGASAQAGLSGKGPTQSSMTNPEWANIDVMDLDTYKSMIANLWATP